MSVMGVEARSLVCLVLCVGVCVRVDDNNTWVPIEFSFVMMFLCSCSNLPMIGQVS